MATQVAGVDLSGLIAAHPDLFVGLGALAMAGELRGIDELKPVLTEFARSANDKIKGATDRLDKVDENQLANNSRLCELAQQTYGRGAGAYSDGGTRESVGGLVTKSEHLERLRNGEIKNLRIPVKEFALSQKATVTSTTVSSQAFRDPGAYGPLARRVLVRDLLVTRPTTAPSVEFLRGTRTGAAAIQVLEGDVKAELAINFTLQTAQVRTIAVWIPASRQVLDDASFLIDYIDIELRDAIALEEDAQLLKGSGVGGNINGLWTQATAYNRAVVGETLNDTWRRSITQIQLSRGVASGIVINPIGLERLELTKDTDGQYIANFTATNNGGTVTWRVPVVVTDALAANEFLVGDFARAARLYDRQQATVEIATQHADFFTRNLVAILAEERVALTVPRPDMLVRGTFL